MKSPKLALVPLLLVAVSGCAVHGGAGHAHLTSAILALQAGAMLHPQADREWAIGEDRHRDDEPVYPRFYAVSAEAAAPRRASPGPQPPVAPPATAFDAQNARSALAQVDLAQCRAAGAPRGYGHARATIDPSGDVSKVVIDEPEGLTPAAVACIGDAIGRTTVPEFGGAAVTVGTTWFVP